MEQIPRLKRGLEVWLNCEASPGPLNEYLVRLKVGETLWFGFVQRSELAENHKRVRATVLDIKNQTITIGIRGHSPTSNNTFQTSREQIASGLSAVA
ncbi:MAG: hypothetical protein ACLQBA_15110 [Candidatus Binataceae bacterium]|jgi:hypothetical protein